MRHKIWILLAALLPVCAAAESAAPFRVIVNPSVAGTKVPRRVLSDIFLGNVTHWGDGQVIAPVDQSTTSTVRASFSKEVLGKLVLAVKAYWARQISGGRGRPPAVKGSDQEVIRFVGESPGAIGYVAADAELPPTVKVIAVD